MHGDTLWVGGGKDYRGRYYCRLLTINTHTHLLQALWMERAASFLCLCCGVCVSRSLAMRRGPAACVAVRLACVPPGGVLWLGAERHLDEAARLSESLSLLSLTPRGGACESAWPWATRTAAVAVEAAPTASRLLGNVAQESLGHVLVEGALLAAGVAVVGHLGPGLGLDGSLQPAAGSTSFSLEAVT